MKGMAFAAIGALALAGCAGAHVKKVAVCDGKHRRPANLYGTVLPTLPVPVPRSQTGAQSMVAPGLTPGPQPLPPASAAPTPAPVFPAPEASPPPAPAANGGATTSAARPRTSMRAGGRSYLSC